jgi:hypothetical protein
VRPCSLARTGLFAQPSAEQQTTNYTTTAQVILLQLELTIYLKTLAIGCGPNRQDFQSSLCLAIAMSLLFYFQTF